MGVHIILLFYVIGRELKIERSIQREFKRDFNIRTDWEKYNCLHCKDQMYLNFKDFDFVPKTHIIESEEDLNSMKRDEKKMYFLKPVDLERGKGIVYGSIKRVSEEYKNLDQRVYVLQESIDPFLIDGKKLSIRCQILLIGGHIYFYKKGMILLATKDYNPQDYSDYSQLTNYRINLDNIEYDDKVHRLPFDDTYEYYEDFLEQMTEIVKKVKISGVLPNVKKNYWFGVDFIVDSSRKCWLLEFNSFPHLATNGILYKEFFREYAVDILNLYCNLKGFDFRDKEDYSKKWLKI